MAYILIVDDDALLGEAVRAVLEAEGHVVGLVQDGQSALNTIALKRPDLVVLDSMMPGMPGEEVLRRVRSSDAYNTPVLMLTARRHQADVQLAMRAGADEYLKKPFDPDELAVAVETLLAGGRKRY